MWIVESLQLKGPNGEPSGIWHLVASSDEGGGIVPCCQHDHHSRDEADDCAEAKERSHCVTGIRPPKPAPSAAELARVAFDAYNVSTGGKTWDGKPVPTFDEIRERTPHVVRAWEAAVLAVHRAVKP